jgi:DNA-binding CsgD family transcriptional regulator
MIIEEENYLMHYGILRRSGRYPWGSGGTQEERNRTFLGMVEDLRSKGMSETEIARGFGITTTELRAARSMAVTARRQSDIAMAQRLKDKGYSNVAIGERMGINESSVRALLAPGQAAKADVLGAVTGMLKDQVATKGMIDIGTGVERHVGVSSTKLATAVAMLKEEGYTVHYLKVEQLGTGQQTTIKVLAGPNVKYGEVYRGRDNIRQITEFSNDGGRTFLGIDSPLSVNSKRVGVRYAEDGGTSADGVIYVRPGVKDLSLGNARYAQVRIAVDGSHYLKGMAVYKDDLPPGVDLVFNTNKSDTGNKLDAFKKMKDDPDNPFGAVVRQIYSIDPKTGKKKLASACNIVNEEGDWEKWSKTLSSQMLSKQAPTLAREQLAITLERKKRELDEIMSLSNPSVRKKLLESYSDDVDSAAVHLKAAALPRQGSHVILPVNSMKETEIYAPNYRDGERVALIRYPHGGIFEIPELTVNNRQPEAKKLLGRARDAVGINSKVAERLSGADFDGDTVLVIPNNHGKVKTEPALQGLINFDPKSAYPGYAGMKKMSARTKAFEMGDVSNLITDMTIRGATQTEIARAVRHSMVVIDAEKHGLNWKQSAIDNGIPQLKAKYQGSAKAGASTLISRASSRKDVNERKARSAQEGGPIDLKTGAKVYTPTGNSWVDAKGKTVFKTQRSTKLAEASDAHSLSSGTPIERIYADHSNSLKALANKARLAMVRTNLTPYSPTARTVYAKQVASLNAKLNIALRNAPLERQAQILANSIVSQKKAANPDLEPSEIKKLKAQALKEARLRTGAHKERVDISNDEWAAIQAGAISSSKLQSILANADIDQIKKLATPKQELLMTSLMRQRATNMATNGYTQSEIADALGVSVSTLKTAL